MFYKKEGFPEDSDLVICTVTKVQSHAVFVNMDEYKISGMINISEVSPGRIRNIRDFVKEGKVIVCKVLKVNRERGHVDLSLRRVSESQKRAKIDQMKQEQKAEKIVEVVAKQLKKDERNVYDKIGDKVFEKYPFLHTCFEDVAMGNVTLESLGVDKEISAKITELVKQRIKPPEVEVTGDMTIESFEPDGISLIKDAMEKVQNDSVDIAYLGAGKYKFTVKAPDYKTAEGIIGKATSGVTELLGAKAMVSFARKEKAK